MSQNATNQTNPKALNETLSKRQQMKLNQAIKIIESQENQQTKHPKRRATSDIHHNQQNPRKQIKIDANINTPMAEDIISSSSQSADPSSLTPSLHHQKSHLHAQHLNPNYEMPEEQGGLFNYLLCYSYSQGEKQFQKQSQDWQSLDMLEGQGLQLVNNSASARICKRLETKFREQKDKLREPLGRNHRQFGQKFFKKEFLLE